jgi:predicted RNA-binding Zn-ribbon protein involved in translation (DUF1610 family)
MIAACHSCGGYIEFRFDEREQRDMAYCPACGWDEEDGGNYVSINMEAV